MQSSIHLRNAISKKHGHTSFRNWYGRGFLPRHWGYKPESHCVAAFPVKRIIGYQEAMLLNNSRYF